VRVELEKKYEKYIKENWKAKAAKATTKSLRNVKLVPIHKYTHHTTIEKQTVRLAGGICRYSYTGKTEMQRKALC